MLRFNCPDCRKALRADDSKAGSAVRCPACGRAFVIPLVEPDSLPAEEHRPSVFSQTPRRTRTRTRRSKRWLNGTPKVPWHELASREWMTPAILLAIGLLLLAASTAVAAGPGGSVAALLLVTLKVVLTIPVTIGAMYVAAWILGISFGTVGTAVLKMVAIDVFVLGAAPFILTAGGLLLGLLGILVSALSIPLLAIGLCMWLFELDFWEAFFAGIIMWLVGAAANVVISTLLGAAGE